jgi:hypothetical protein
MTYGELTRFLDSKVRQELQRLRERATMDYNLAILVGRAVQGSSEENPFPDLYEAYPNLFAKERKRKEEEEAERQAQLSAIRFMQFANSFNSKFDEEANG